MIDHNHVNEAINKLLVQAKQNNIANKDIKDIQKAVVFAKRKHEGQFRKSGEPYIIHPLSTASILMSWKMDVKTIITGILHDVLEDTPTTEQEIQENFGDDVLNLVRHVTKVSLLSKRNRRDYNQKTDVENNYIVQVFLSMSEDIRSMIVKLADRYHNMLTIEYLKPDKQRQIASETMDIYSKVAGRLGMYRLKTDLQDLSFKVLNPIEYKMIKDRIAIIVEINSTKWHSMIDQIKSILDSYSIEYQIKERLKGIYSTWEKISRNYTIREIHDIYALRIIVNDNLECYKVLGLVHLNFKFLKNAFKDYISSPKLNSYQSIHTTILKNQSLLEVQIRTSEMDTIAENGIAAHWNYKDKLSSSSQNLNKSFHLISEISNMPTKTVDDIRRLTNDIVFDVLVSNNESRYVVNNRTRAIDLAYRVDNDNFKFLKTIIVNGQQVSFDSLLKPNDVIKINYSKDVLINRKWLRFTQFHATKEGINKILKDQYHQQILDVDKFLNKLKTSLKGNYIGDKKAGLLIKRKLKIDTVAKFLEFITVEIYDDPNLILCFNKHKGIARKGFAWLVKKYGWLLNKPKEFYFNKIEGLYFSDLTFPHCCNKVPYMDVVGKVTKRNILEIHNQDCAFAKKGPLKVYPLVWNEEVLRNNPRKFRYQLSFIADWTPSIGNIISKKIVSFHLMLNELKIEKNKPNDTCNVSIVVYASELQHVKSWFAELSQEIDVKNNINF